MGTSGTAEKKLFILWEEVGTGSGEERQGNPSLLMESMP